MTHPYTKAELVSIAASLEDDEMVLCDMYDRENFNGIYGVDLTVEQWRQFIDFYSEYHGLESLIDEVDTFIDRHGTDALSQGNGRAAA